MVGAGRNLLTALVAGGELTHEEIVTQYNACARSMGEGAVLSVRTLRRWLAGDTNWPRPAQRRVAQRYWGYPMAELLAPADPGAPAAAGSQQLADGWALPALNGIEARLVMATRRAGEFSRLMQSGGIGGEALELLKDEVADLAAVGESLPVLDAVGQAIELQEATFAAIERGGHRVRDARELFVAAAMVTAMLSRLTQDLGRSQQALSLCRTVYVCADAAEHLSLQAWARNEMSLICYRTGSTRRALDFADSAVALSQHLRGSTRAWAWSLKARAAAMIQSEAEVRVSIEHARQARESLVPDDLDEIGGLFEFSGVRQTYYAAGALAALPTAAIEAERAALEAVSFFEDSTGSYATEAGARSELALARVNAGELEGAAEALVPVLALPPERRITGIVDSVTRVHQALSGPQVRASSAATQLRDEIESYRALSAARAVGSG